jgi:hypothetical protein
MVASEAEGWPEALRRIAACRAAQAEELDLGGLQLPVLDGEPLAALCQLGWLRRLFLVSSIARNFNVDLHRGKHCGTQHCPNPVSTLRYSDNHELERRS